MSIRIMSQVWEVDLPASEKLVLLALADCANDEGGCWPSMATLSSKCSKSERTIQTAIKALVAAGHVLRDERPGRGCFYIVRPVSSTAPAKSAPPQKLRPAKSAPPQKRASTPAKSAPHPRRICTQTIIEPSRTVIDDVERERAIASAGSDQPPSVVPRRPVSAVDVADAAARAAGVRNIEPATIQRNVKLASDWLADGLDLEADILPAIRDTVAHSTERITSLRYFDAPIRQAKARKEAIAHGNGDRSAGQQGNIRSAKVRAALAAIGTP